MQAALAEAMNWNLLLQQPSYPLLRLLVATAVALLLGYLVQAVGQRLLRRITRHFTIVSTLVERTRRPSKLAVPLLFLQATWVAAPADWPLIDGLTHACALALMASLTWLVIRAINGVADTIVALSPVSVADNLHARRIYTQTRVIARCLNFLVLLIGVALMLMTFPAIRAIGTSLLASAGLAGIVAGVAARPVLSNLIAGLQIALSQPIRIDDVLIVEGEWGRVEEITGTYVVIAIWDERRLIVPLQWFIEHPFQNWTRKSAELLGTVFFWVDYRMPLDPLRAELTRVCEAAPEWDRRLATIQVTDTSNSAVQIRALVSARDSGKAWDLRCRVREALIDFMQREYPDYLPRIRTDVTMTAQGTGDRPS